MGASTSGSIVSDWALDGPQHDLTDEAVAEAAKSRTTEFGELYRRHWLGVFRYMRTLSRSHDEAADLTALAFERASGAIGSYRPGRGSFAGWLYRLARNVAIDEHRRRRPLTSLMTLAEGEPADHWSPEREALRRESTPSCCSASVVCHRHSRMRSPSATEPG